MLTCAAVGTIGKRFDKINLKNEEENRRAYRQLLFKAGTEMAKHISGVIMFHETFFHKADDGTPLPKVLESLGVIPGIKVDKGTVNLAGTSDEFTTQGLLTVILYRVLSHNYLNLLIVPLSAVQRDLSS